MKKPYLIIMYVLVATAVLFFLIVAVPKIFFPYEAHWMEGAMLGEISWILAGHPLYLPPSIYHVPSVYQPLYYYVTAGITSITGLTFATARISSILATATTIAMIYWVARKETGKYFFGISAVGLYIAAYGKTEFCYVSSRIDPMLTCLLVAAFVIVYYVGSYRGLFLGAMLFALSFFTKQSALVFLPSVFLYLSFLRGWKQGLVFLASVIAFIFLGIVTLNFYFNGWYTFYTFNILRSMAKSARWIYAMNGFIFYIFLRCWFLTILLLVFPLRSFFRISERRRDSATIYFGLFFATGIIAGFLGILNAGGGHNVLLQAAAGCSLFLPIIVSELSNGYRYSKIALWVIPLQLLLLISNPWSDKHNIITETDKENNKKFFSYVSSLPGEVWIPYHGFIGQYIGKRDYAGFDFADGAMLPDESRAESLRHQFDTAFTNRHWSNILSDYQQAFPHYRLSSTVINFNKFNGNDDSLLYIYTSE